MKFKKLTAAILSTAMALSLLSGCSLALKQDDGASVNFDFGDDGSISISSDLAPGLTAGIDEDADITVTKDIIVLYTNDVHCGVDDAIGYAGLSAYKKELEAEGYPVLLCDAGDEIQGASLGTLSKGEAIIKLMNLTGYDVAAIGNHGFDYGPERLFELTAMADYPYVCCNLKDSKTGKLIYDPYKILECGGKKIAFVGVLTPSTYTSSYLGYFVDDNGNHIYDFSELDGDEAFYGCIQKAVDDARDEGADYCILLSHLGIDPASTSYMSTDVIKNTIGIDVVFDAHSHSEIEMEKVRNADGKDVILSQTGTKLDNIGRLTIGSDGDLKTELISDYEEKDEDITKAIEKERSVYSELLEEVIGKSDYDLCISDEEGNRVVRNVETNLGDLVADSYRYITGADIGLVNSGSVRSDISAGDLTYEDILNVEPFSNRIVKIRVKGQAIADALEFGVSNEPEEFGGFLQVSGLEFTVDLDQKADVKKDENGLLLSIEGDERRVSDIKVNGKALDPDKEYTIAGNEYLLMKEGDGHTSFNGEEENTGYIEDINATISYIKEELNGRIPDTYADRYGDGRINFK